MKFAFTLAEVLITLGIIGIVAVITIPTLVRNYQKKVWVNQLKVAYATLNQATTLAMADANTDSILETDIYRNCLDAHTVVTDSEGNKKIKGDVNACASAWRKYIKTAEIFQTARLGETYSNTLYGEACKSADLGVRYWYYLNDKNTCYGFNTFTLSILNSMILDISVSSSEIYGGYMSIMLDINGRKGPNTLGRDAFYLRIPENGRVYAVGSRPLAEIYAKNNNTSYTSQYWKNNSSYKCDETATKGNGCAARIIEEGWVMNY